MYYRAGWGYSKEFFNGSDARNYFATFHGKMKSEVDQMSDAEIVSCNFEEWADYLAEKYFIAPSSVFETNIERLEQIVRAMERGEISLDESLKLFQEGTALVQSCTKLLDDAELVVNKVMQGAGGEPVKGEFSYDADL